MRVAPLFSIVWSLCAFRYVTDAAVVKNGGLLGVEEFRGFDFDEPRHREATTAQPTTTTDAQHTTYASLITPAKMAVRIPSVLYAVVKSIGDDHDSIKNMSITYVDHVYEPKYNDVQASEYDRMLCGSINLVMYTDYCDCWYQCRNPDVLPKMWSAKLYRREYRLTYYVDDVSVYFTTKPVNDAGVPFYGKNNQIGDHVTGKTFGPFERMIPVPGMNFYHYGHITGSGKLVPIAPYSLLEERVINEWVAYANTYEHKMRSMLWRMGPTRQESWPEDDSKQDLRPHEQDSVLSVTFSPDYTVTFDRMQCMPLISGNFSSDQAVVNSGGCVRLYENWNCTGSSRMVVENHVRFNEEYEKLARRPALRPVKSVVACCSDAPPQWRSDVDSDWENWQMPTVVDRVGGRPPGDRCKCPCSELNLDPPTTNASEGIAPYAEWLRRWPTAVAGPKDPRQHTNGPSSTALRVLCTDALSAFNAIKEKTVDVAIAKTPAQAVAAANDVMDLGWNTLGKAAGVLALLDALPSIENRGWAETLAHSIEGIMNTLIDITDSDPVTPGTASMLSANVAVQVWNLQALMWDVYEFSANNGAKPKKPSDLQIKLFRGQESKIGK